MNATMEVAETEELQAAAEAISAELVALCSRDIETSNTIDEIVCDVRKGHAARANEIAGLIAEQNELARTIAQRQAERRQIETEIQRVKDAADRTKAAAILDRMEQHRERAINAAREASLALGMLHEDGKKVAALIPPILGAPGRERLVALLQPINPLSGIWLDGVRSLPLDYLHVVKIFATTPL